LAGRTVPVDPPHIGERGKPWEEVDRPGPSAVVAAEVE
jgi:hypothetical protein